jgi:hypothetical protein
LPHIGLDALKFRHDALAPHQITVARYWLADTFCPAVPDDAQPLPRRVMEQVLGFCLLQQERVRCLSLERAWIGHCWFLLWVGALITAGWDPCRGVGWELGFASLARGANLQHPILFPGMSSVRAFVAARWQVSDVITDGYFHRSHHLL